MSVKPTLTLLAPGLLMFGGLAYAADEEIPDMEFLEYLGMWQETDEEWLVFEGEADRVAIESEERIDPVPTGDESKEFDDEG